MLQARKLALPLGTTALATAPLTMIDRLVVACGGIKSNRRIDVRMFRKVSRAALNLFFQNAFVRLVWQAMRPVASSV
jgi:hypothetical protein